MTFVGNFRQRLLLCLASCVLIAPAVAQPVLESNVLPGEHMSDWLLRNGPVQQDLTSLHWLVPTERFNQEKLKRAVLAGLTSFEQLAQRLGDMPLTGRLGLARQDPRWLQAVPDQDPVLSAGQQVRRYPRPANVSFLSESGAVCQVPHQPGAMAIDYLSVCVDANEIAEKDFAWVAQPDGRIRRYGTAVWSQTEQDQIAPGAWIWAPGRNSGISHRVSDNLIRFLATQPPYEFSANGEGPQLSPPMKALTPSRDRQSNAVVTASDWGEIGLLQTPTARMSPAGELRFTMSKVEPYTRGNLMMQPFDWLEAGFRYSDISNFLYGASIAGDQTLKDKSFDLKVRLLEESARLPQLSVGVRDIGGTGLFASEYLVANKRWGNWDASMGLGWGNMGTRADLTGFGSRQGNTDINGGTTNFKDMFRGPAAWFGGVQWQLPQSSWLLKAEWEGNNYQNELYGSKLAVNSAVNWGAAYRLTPNWDFSAAWERGNRFMLGFTYRTALQKEYVPKALDPVMPAIQSSAPSKLAPQGWGETAKSIYLHTGWRVQRIDQSNGVASSTVETDGAPYAQLRMDKVISLFHKDAPADIRHFEFQLMERGLPLSVVDVDRSEWVSQHTSPVPPAMRLPQQHLSEGYGPYVASKATTEADTSISYVKNDKNTTDLDWSPSYQQVLGGPNGFLLYQIGLQANLEHRFSASTWFNADFNARLLDNYKEFTFDGNSNLPRVRTLMREFTTTSRATMPLAQLTSVADLGRGNYASVYGGMLEWMYGGVGAEWLYRPWQGDFAFGLDVNHVKQRDFKQNLEFRNYSVNTGHATLYWDTGWNNVQATLSLGQYLAGDVGATLDVKRVFPNGVAMGAWATKTNVSAEQFGEGSFDKGVYVSIPFDVFAAKSTNGIARLAWNPLTRDGGAKLERRFQLYDMTRYRDARTWNFRPWVEQVNETARDASYILTDPPPTLLENPLSAGGKLGSQIADIPGSTWMWAGGVVLASGLLDNTVDKWVQNHSGNRSLSNLGSITNSMPFVLAAGTGVAAMGLLGDSAANTAATSVTAAAYALGANYLVRFAAGRARPTDENGPDSFQGFKSEAVRTGFASNHVAVAFALATPFAQQYNMPWLYGAAASTGLGRLNDREHWLSDTVAGGLMGYAIGSLLSDQQQGLRRGVRLTATPQSIDATWNF